MAESSAGLCACGKPGCSDDSDQTDVPLRDLVHPATVAMVRIGRFTYGPALWDDYDGQWVDHKKGRLHPGGIVPEVRPLLVIDPEDREQVERLAMAHGGVSGDAPLTGDLWSVPGLRMQAALRELITPPKPAIPECPDGCTEVLDVADDVWTLKGDYWNYPGMDKSWVDLWTDHGPLRPVGPVLSAGIGDES